MTNEDDENLESEVINLIKQLPLEEPMTAVREYIDEEGIYSVMKNKTHALCSNYSRAFRRRRRRRGTRESEKGIISRSY